MSRLWTSFADDWRGRWWSLGFAVCVVLAFSQVWQAPLFGYSDTMADGLLIRAFYYPFYICGIALAVIAWRRLLSATWRTPLMLALVLLCLVSAAWSIDPATTIRRFVALFMTVLCAYAMAARFSWARLTEVLAIAFGFMMVLSVVLAVAFPHLGKMQELFPGAWRGAWVEKNALGALMSLGFVAAAAAALHNPSRRVVWGVIAACMVAVVLLSTSKTALLGIIIGFGGIAFIWFARKGPVIGIVLTWLAVSCLLGFGLVLVFQPDLIFVLLGKDATLTGRTFIWDGIRRVIAERPNTGYGYGVVWTTEGEWTPLAKIIRVASFRPYHAHSSWLEVWLGLGIGGLVLWAVVFAETWLKGFYRTFRGDGGYFALPFLGIFTLSTLSESMALSWNDLRWCLFVLVLVKLSLKGDVDSDEAEESETAQSRLLDSLGF